MAKFLNFNKSLPSRVTVHHRRHHKKARIRSEDEVDENIHYEYIIRPPNGGFGWVVCFCAFYTFFVVDGILFSSGMLMDKTLTLYKLTPPIASIVWSVTFGMRYLLGPVCSACMRHIGLRPTAFIGAILTTFALILATLPPPFWLLVVLVGGMGGLGMCFLFMTSIAIVTNYFSTLRIYALGIVGTGTGLGILVFANLSLTVMDDMTWQNIFLLYSGFSVVLLIVVLNYIPLLPVRVKLVNNVIVHEADEESSDDSDDSDDTISEENEKGEKRKKTFWERWLGKKAFKKERRAKHAINKFHVRCVKWCKRRSSILANTIKGRNSRVEKPSTSNKKRWLQKSSLTRKNLKLKYDKLKTAASERLKRPRNRTTVQSLKMSAVEMPKQLEDFVQDVFDMRELTNIHILAFCLSGGLGAVGFLIGYTYEAERTRDDGYQPEYGKIVVALMGAMNILWRLQLGFISEIPGIPYHFVYHISMIAAGLSTILSTEYTSYFFKICYSACFSFGQACFSVYRPAMLLELAHHEKISNVSGINLLFMGIMSIPGPPLAGWFTTLTGNYDIVFWFSGGLLILSTLVFLPTTLIRVLKNDDIEDSEESLASRN